MLGKLTATLSRATNAVSEKAANYIPASKASKIAKAMILVMVCMVAMPMTAHAADFITEAIDILGVVIIAIGGWLGIWGVVNLLEGYGNDNPGAKSQGIKQLMAGLGIAK
jgi:protein-S-isoprenylcysteine O-methyltransferase Ste14